MSLADILRNGIATARSITLPLHVTVTHVAWTGEAYDGAPITAAKMYKALVDKKQRLVRNQQGQEVMSTCAIYVLEEIAPTTPILSTNPRSNPVDPRDKFICPDGTTGPIVSVDGFFDGGTGVPYYSQIYLG